MGRYSAADPKVIVTLAIFGAYADLSLAGGQREVARGARGLHLRVQFCGGAIQLYGREFLFDRISPVYVMPTDTASANLSMGRVQIALIGCNHRTAPLELRERIVFTPEQALRASDELRPQRHAGRGSCAFHVQPQRAVWRFADFQ